MGTLRDLYVRRRSLGSTSAVTNGGSASNVEAAGAVAYSSPDASLALLASTSSSPSIVEVALLDPARLEANIVSQLYFGTTSSLVGDDYGPPLVRDRQVRSLLSSLASALYSSNVVPVHILSVSLPRCNNFAGLIYLGGG